MVRRHKRTVLIAFAFALTFVGSGVADAMAAPTCNGIAATIVGTSGDDRIVGTDGSDVIVARGGDDVVWARGDNDLVCGGGGNDR
ncbi:MAG TPA: hypothetical protein VLA87_12770, partial [Gaiellaceae bacterium]|nr:hypothetical protein [Gaiellaceae bacterium]